MSRLGIIRDRLMICFLHSFNLQITLIVQVTFHHNKNVCDQCGQEFKNYEDLIDHARHIHHHPIVKCHVCGKEFIHEKDRLHHVREEHEKKEDYRTHKDSYKTKKVGPIQDEVDASTKNFG